MELYTVDHPADAVLAKQRLAAAPSLAKVLGKAIVRPARYTVGPPTPTYVWPFGMRTVRTAALLWLVVVAWLSGRWNLDPTLAVVGSVGLLCWGLVDGVRGWNDPRSRFRFVEALAAAGVLLLALVVDREPVELVRGTPWRSAVIEDLDEPVRTLVRDTCERRWDDPRRSRCASAVDLAHMAATGRCDVASKVGRRLPEHLSALGDAIRLHCEKESK